MAQRYFEGAVVRTAAVTSQGPVVVLVFQALAAVEFAAKAVAVLLYSSTVLSMLVAVRTSGHIELLSDQLTSQAGSVFPGTDC